MLCRGSAVAVDYRMLVEGSVDVIFQVRLTRDDFLIEYVSPSVTEMLGWSVEETLRLTPQQVYTAKSLQQVWFEVEQLLRGSDKRMAELEVFRKNGSTVWVDCRVRLVEHDAAKGCVVVVANMHDISERKQLQEDLAELVLVDALTGVGSRRAFDAAMKRAWALSQTTGEPLSLVMVDVDHFKRMNDTCGHQAGDACLRAIAGAVRHAVELPHAFVARYGGEELALLLPQTGAAMAETVARRVCGTVATLRLGDETETVYALQMTVSCGVSTANGDSFPTCMPEGLVAAADRALYRAKALGRNRVEVETLNGQSSERTDDA